MFSTAFFFFGDKIFYANVLGLEVLNNHKENTNTFNTFYEKYNKSDSFHMAVQIHSPHTIR